jgi:formylglycine-generating enzyme required for sulfatase activity
VPIVLVLGFASVVFLSAQSTSTLTRVALFEPSGEKSDVALTAILTTVADSVELNLDVLQRFDVRRLPPADPAKDMDRIRAYCEANHIDQAILGSGSAKPEGGYLFKLLVYDRRRDSITLAPEGSSTGALDMFDVTDQLVSTLLDGLSGTHLLFGSLSVETDPAGAAVTVNGKDVGTAPLTLRALPVGTVQLAARSAGHEDAAASVTITDGGAADVPMTLARSTGTLALAVPKDAVVTAASQEIGRTQISGPGSTALPTGDYDVQAASPGLPAANGKVTISRGTTTQWVPWPKGYLDVQAVPAGAAIVVDGVERGVSPLLVDVDPGIPHHVQLKLAKFDVYGTDVTAAAGDKTILAPELVAKALPGGFVRVAPGSFAMGSPLSEPNRYPNEGPQHDVRLSGFAIGQYKVTQGEWQAVMGTNPSFFKGNGRLPVEQVSWYDILVYCNKRSISEGLTPCYSISGTTDPGRWGVVPTSQDTAWDAAQCDFRADGYRLPTEAEWEYACRAGTITATAFGNTLASSQANFDGGSPYNTSKKGTYLKRTAPVGSYPANAWGIYDMHGNLWEWCWDWYDEKYYSQSPALDPRGPESGAYRVLRGGSWGNRGYDLRSATRNFSYNTSNRNNLYGFRLVVGL